ncbi:hypothetical protein BDY24DRAFT_393875 [Mrakia frigida]|uniref:uncharacterized protein n=1 Tax=Mrakia frigida TaxID=29902 RepID=UPI003FCC0F1B
MEGRHRFLLLLLPLDVFLPPGTLLRRGGQRFLACNPSGPTISLVILPQQPPSSFNHPPLRRPRPPLPRSSSNLIRVRPTVDRSTTPEIRG